jgi:hypothetical protein
LQGSDACSSTSELYAVWISNKQRALGLVMERAKVNGERVDVICELDDGALRGCKLPKGKCRLLQAAE